MINKLVNIKKKNINTFFIKNLVNKELNKFSKKIE